MENATAFETVTGFTGLEMLFVLGLLFAGTLLWLRATDVAVRVVGAVLPLLGAGVLLMVSAEVGFGDVSRANLAFAAIQGLLGVYLLVRVFVDYWLSGAPA